MGFSFALFPKPCGNVGSISHHLHQVGIRVTCSHYMRSAKFEMESIWKKKRRR